MQKGIMFDMGDTIVHNIDINYSTALKSIYQLFKNTNVSFEKFNEYGLKILNEIFNERRIVEFKMIDYIKLLIDTFNLSSEFSLSYLEEVFAINCCNIKIVEGIEELLAYLKNKNYKLIVLSNTSFSKKVIKKMLGDLNIYFDDIIVSSEYPLRKPHNSLFNVGTKKLNLSNENIYYIGNSFDYDVIGAINSNINSIWFNEEKIKQTNILNYKYLEINSYKELIEMDF